MAVREGPRTGVSRSVERDKKGQNALYRKG